MLAWLGMTFKILLFWVHAVLSKGTWNIVPMFDINNNNNLEMFDMYLALLMVYSTDTKPEEVSSISWEAFK